MSKKSSDDTGDRTKQAMKSKALTMKHPARPAILGYRTDGPEGAKKWVIDPVTGPLITRVFEQFSTGNYTFDEIAEYAYQIGLRSTSTKNSQGKISKNTWRNRLTDIQYTGIFYHDDEKIIGKYDALVSTELFYRVQDVITGNAHPKNMHVDYAYSGMIKCGLCGGMLSATHKKGITYYRCGKRLVPCKSINPWPYIPEKEIEKSLVKKLEMIEIDQETWIAAREYVVELNQPKRLDLAKQIRMLNEQIAIEETMQINLGRKFTNGELTKSDYNKLKFDSEKKTASLRNSIIKCENIVHEIDELMYQFLDNVKHVTKRFTIALPENKRELVDIFCENLEWKDGKLRWDWKKAYYIFVNQPKNSTMLPR